MLFSSIRSFSIFAVLFVFLSFAGQAAGKQQNVSFPIVENGVAKADILVQPSAGLTEHFAARELQDTIMRITGTRLFITNHKYDKPCIILTTYISREMSEKRELFDRKNIFKIKDNDGFIIKPLEGDIYILGFGTKGILNGVYSFLEENTDIIWSRANADGTVFTPTKTITATRTDYMEAPSFKYRGYSYCGYMSNPGYSNLMWFARNRLNYLTVGPHLTYLMGIYEKLGISTCMTGHNLYYWIPNRVYFKDKPEYFAQTDGVRRELSMQHGSLCFTNEELVDLFVGKIDKLVIDKLPVEFISIKLLDNRVCCECEKCSKPIKLPDGKVLKPGDKNFFSTQFFIFLNKVAEKVAEKHPNVKLDTFSYFETTPAPAVKLHKNIWVMFAPAIRDDKHTLLEPSNANWKKIIEDWKKVTSNIIWREYYFTYIRFPRPLEDTVAKDLRYLLSLDFKGVTSEIISDVNYGSGHGRKLWDASSMQCWILARLFWNPELDPAKLRDEYLKRTYGPAAPYMAEYYTLIRDAWFANPENETFMTPNPALAQKYIKEPGNEEKCRKALESALAHAGTEQRKRLVKAVKDLFEKWMGDPETIETGKQSIKVPATTENPAGNLNFSSEPWTKAAVINGFKPTVKSKGNSQKTKIYLLHDAKNLYVGCECFDDDIANITRDEKYKETSRELFPALEDRMEIFLSNPKSYAQFAYGVSGTRYDGTAYNKDWNADWTVTVQTDKDAWRSVAVIPLKELLPADKKEKALKGYFYRAYHPGGKQYEQSGWNGGQVHSPAVFGEIILED